MAHADMTDRAAEAPGQPVRHVAIAQQLRTGEDDVGVGRLTGRQGHGGNGRYVPGIDERNAALTGGRIDRVVLPDGVQVLLFGEVLHEPGRTQDTPFRRHFPEHGMNGPHHRSAGRKRRGAEQDEPADAHRQRAFDCRDHDVGVVRPVGRGNQVSGMDAFESGRKGFGPGPVEAHLVRSVAGSGGGSDGHAHCGQMRRQAASGLAAGANDQRLTRHDRFPVRGTGSAPRRTRPPARRATGSSSPCNAQ